MSWPTEAKPEQHGFAKICCRPPGSSERLEITMELPQVWIYAGYNCAAAGWREPPLPVCCPSARLPACRWRPPRC